MDQIGNGRLGLNSATGRNRPDYDAFGIDLPQERDSRYEQAPARLHMQALRSAPVHLTLHQQSSTVPADTRCLPQCRNAIAGQVKWEVW